MKRFPAAMLLLCLLLTVLSRSALANTQPLTDADYLAFCAVSNLKLEEGETVRNALDRNFLWNAVWDESQGITYAKLCEDIAAFRVVQTFDQSDENGFYAALLADEHKNGVLVFRGSVPPDRWTQDRTDATNDWIKNDFPIELGNRMGTQYESALEAYRLAEDSCKTLTVTGHSLGGAWADTVSALYGCRGVSFNAVSVLDVLYRHDPKRASELFSGTDAWNFVDHTNEFDVLAGMFEAHLATEIKPYIAHKSNIAVDASALEAFGKSFSAIDLSGITLGVFSLLSDDILQCHSLQSFVTLNESGKVCLTEVVSRFEPSSAVTGSMPSASCFVELGQSGDDRLTEGLSSLAPGTLYGGDGNDTLIASTLADELIGGRGNDTLDGSRGDDIYHYRVGDGTDLITDVAGDDTLMLYQTESDEVSIRISEDGLHIEICIDGQIAVRILRTARSSDAGTFRVIWNGYPQNITQMFTGNPIASRTVIDGASSVWIVDSLGKLTGTAEHTGSNAYGNIYVPSNSKRIVELCAGYTVRFLGTADGKAEIRHQRATRGTLSYTQVLSDLTVKEDYTATLTQDKDGSLSVRMEVASLLSGDVDASGSLGARDYMMLKLYILGTYQLSKGTAHS